MTISNTLTIIQHNVLHWKNNKESLITNYLETKPDIILTNSHGLKDTDSMKIPGYKCHKINTTQALHDGSAIAIKYNLQYKLLDNFETDFLAVEVNTTLGPVIIATTYLPPRRPYLPFPDMYTLLNNTIPTYIIGDFNCSHMNLGNRRNNNVGKSLILIDQGKLLHLGPHFPTFIRSGSATNPDKIFSNKHSYLNTLIEQGNITSSDHLPIIFKLSTKPFYIKQTETYNMGKANWNLFKATLDSNIKLKTLNNYSKEQIELETTKWLNTVKQAMDTAIPKTTYKPIYQIRATPR